MSLRSRELQAPRLRITPRSRLSRQCEENVRYLWLAIIGISLSSAAAQVPAQQILSYKQYASIDHKSPYVLEFKLGTGALLFYGAEHTGDPKNPQISDIERRWAAFHPTVAYNEGGNPATLRDPEEAVHKYAEAGFLRYLAGRDQVPVATFEPSFDDEISYLLKRYSPEQVKTFYALRQVTEARRLQTSTPLDDRIQSWQTTCRLTA
jgi:hypothetical protein